MEKSVSLSCTAYSIGPSGAGVGVGTGGSVGVGAGVGVASGTGACVGTTTIGVAIGGTPELVGVGSAPPTMAGGAAVGVADACDSSSPPVNAMTSTTIKTTASTGRTSSVTNSRYWRRLLTAAP